MGFDILSYFTQEERCLGAQRSPVVKKTRNKTILCDVLTPRLPVGVLHRGGGNTAFGWHIEVDVANSRKYRVVKRTEPA